MTDFTKEGWAAATDYAERVYEAATFFNTHRSGSPVAQATLTEAFSTPDFPVLLGDAFEKKAIAAQKAAVFEFDGITAKATRPDFQRGKLVDLWSNDEFEQVAEGEEYKGGTLNETELTHGTEKWGKNYGLTFELRLRRMFSDLAKFPELLGNGAVRAKNTAIGKTLVTDAGAWNPDLFGEAKTAALDAEGLEAALTELGQREDHRGDLVDTTNLVLIIGPALQIRANQLINADKLLVKQTNGNKETRVEVPNPYKGLVTILVSRTIGKRLGANQSSAWALVQGAGSTLPSLIETGLEGHDGNVDIRVKRDQGDSVSGGAINPDQGSFKDDTVWYRGRTFFGIDKGFGTGVYASAGK